MSTLLELIKTQLSDSHYASFGQAVGAAPAQTKSAVDAALPLLVSVLSGKASGAGGSDFLTSLLDQNKDGSVLDDLLGMLAGGGGAAPTSGQAALRSILGGQQQAAQEHVAQASGLSLDAVAKLLPMLAPLVVAALTKAQSSADLDRQGGLRALIEKEQASIAQSDPQTGDFATALLDQNRDGSMVDDVIRMGASLLGGMAKK